MTGAQRFQTKRRISLVKANSISLWYSYATKSVIIDYSNPYIINRMKSFLLQHFRADLLHQINHIISKVIEGMNSIHQNWNLAGQLWLTYPISQGNQQWPKLKSNIITRIDRPITTKKTLMALFRTYSQRRILKLAGMDLTKTQLCS